MPEDICCENVRHLAPTTAQGACLPQEVTIYTANGPHFPDFCSQADNLDPDMGAWLDHHISIVSKLRRRRVRIILDLVGHQLQLVSR